MWLSGFLGTTECRQRHDDDLSPPKFGELCCCFVAQNWKSVMEELSIFSADKMIDVSNKSSVIFPKLLLYDTVLFLETFNEFRYHGLIKTKYMNHLCKLPFFLFKVFNLARWAEPKIFPFYLVSSCFYSNLHVIKKKNCWSLDMRSW